MKTILFLVLCLIVGVLMGVVRWWVGKNEIPSNGLSAIQRILGLVTVAASVFILNVMEDGDAPWAYMGIGMAVSWVSMYLTWRTIKQKTEES